MTHRRIFSLYVLVLAATLGLACPDLAAAWERELVGEGHIAPDYDVRQSWKLEYHANLSSYADTSGRAFAYDRMNSDLAWDFTVKWATLQDEFVMLAGERVKDTAGLGGETMFLVVWDSGEPGGDSDEVYPFAYTQAQIKQYFGSTGSWDHPAWEDHATEFLDNFRGSVHARNRWLLRSGDLRAEYSRDDYPYSDGHGPGYYYDPDWYYYVDDPYAWADPDPVWWNPTVSPGPTAPDDWFYTAPDPAPAPAAPDPDDYTFWDEPADDWGGWGGWDDWDWGDWGESYALARRAVARPGF